MTLEQLRIFVAVAERQHVTKAARYLNLAQSAASHAIATLEARHDVRLFDRIGRRVELTGAGRAFLDEAKAVLAQAERAEQTLGAFGRLERGTLKVEASQTIASYWLPRHLVAFRRRYPRIDIQLAIGNTAQVADAIETGAAELGFVEDRVERDALESIAIASDQLVIVVAPDHPWATAGRIDPHDLIRREWVLREAGSGTRSAFESALRRLGVSPDALKVAMDLPSNEAVRAAVEAGLGATAISASVAAPGIEAALLARVDCALPPRSFDMLTHRARSASRVAEALMTVIGVERAGAIR